MLAAGGQDIGDPDPYRQKVEEHEDADKHREHGRELTEDAESDHEPQKGPVKAQPDDRDGKHLQHAGPDKGGFFRLAAPEQLLALRQDVLNAVAFHTVAFFEIIFAKSCHFLSLLILSS